MKLIIFIILSLIGLSYCDGINTNQTITWDDTVNCGTNPGCNWNTATNWIGGDIPSNQDSVIIDFRNTTFTTVQTVIINGTVPALTNIYIYGNVVGGQPNAKIIFYGQKITIIGNITFNGVSVNLNNNEIDGIDMTLNSTILNASNDSDISLNGWIYVDAASTYNFHDTSKSFITETATFHNQPKFYDKSQFYTAGLFNPFYAGVVSEGLVHVNNAMFFGISSIQTLSAVGSIDVMEDAIVTVTGTVSLSAASKIHINPQATFQASGSGSINIFGGIVDAGGSLLLTGTQFTLSNIQSDGSVTLNSQNGQVSGSNFSQLAIQGLSNIEILDSTVVDFQAFATPGQQSKFFINLGGATKINNITSDSETYITVVDGGVVTVYDHINMTGTGSITVTGTLQIEANTVYAGSLGFFLEDPLAELDITDSFVISPVTVNGGAFNPTNIQIMGVITINKGYMALNYPGADLTAAGGIVVAAGGTIYIFNSQDPTYLPPFTVTPGQPITLLGTLIVTFENSIQFGAVYPLIQVPSNPNANFTTVSPLYNNALYESQNYRITYVDDSNTIGLEFYTQEEPSNKLAGWKVFLIILSILIVLGGGAYFFIRHKRNQGYIAIN